MLYIEISRAFGAAMLFKGWSSSLLSVKLKRQLVGKYVTLNKGPCTVSDIRGNFIDEFLLLQKARIERARSVWWSSERWLGKWFHTADNVRSDASDSVLDFHVHL